MSRQNHHFRFVVLFLFFAMLLASCTPHSSSESLPLSSVDTTSETTVADIISEAMTLNQSELYKRAVLELDGKELNAVSDSSRGLVAKEHFLNYLRGKSFNATLNTFVVDESIRSAFPYFNEGLDATINWIQPKNNNITTHLLGDMRLSEPTISLALFANGAKLQANFTEIGLTHNYIPREWAGDITTDGDPFALQSISKVFAYNTAGGTKAYTNMWDFVAPGERPQIMGLIAEPVGYNALIMMTRVDYSDVIKSAFNALPQDETTDLYLDDVNGLIKLANTLGLTHASAPFALAWIKRFLTQMETVNDDMPLALGLTANENSVESGLLHYAKLGRVLETEEQSINNIKIAAYESGYSGLGGYMYKHYLQITKNAPLPWTAAAFIHYMATTYNGFAPWGVDLGHYSSDPRITPDRITNGYVEEHSMYPALNDRGHDWWAKNEAGFGRLVIEDPLYAANGHYSIGDWVTFL